MRFAWVVLVVACGRIGFDPVASSNDATFPSCTTFGPWTPAVALTSLNSPYNDESPALSTDGTELYFSSDRGASHDLFVATLLSPGAFSTPTLAPNLNDPVADDDNPTLTRDGLGLYFDSDRSGSQALYYATRATTADPFGAPTIVPELATYQIDGPDVTAAGDEMFYDYTPDALFDLELMPRIDGVWTMSPGAIDELNVTNYQAYPSVSNDGLDLYFATLLDTDDGATDIFVASRAVDGLPFAPARRVDEASLAGGSNESDPEISKDGTTLMFSSDRPGMGELDLYMITRTCE